MTERTRNDHCTPEAVLEVVRAYAPIGLDPCANPWSTVGARVELSQHRGEDGLAASWSDVFSFSIPAGLSSEEFRAAFDAALDSGRHDEIVYCNPPYSAGAILPWVEKAAQEAEDGVETLLLVPCSPETQWAQAAHAWCSAWGPWRRRIPFVGAGLKGGMKGPSALYHFGPRRYLFAHHFEEHLAFVEVT